MFSSLGAFRNISCPQKYDCSLPVCIFSHSSLAPSPDADEECAAATEYDPFSAGGVSPPPAKRRRVASPPRDAETVHTLGSKNASLGTPAPSIQGRPPLLAPGSVTGPQQSNGASKAPLATTKRAPGSVKPVSAARPVSPPPIKATNLAPLSNRKRPLKVESLTPRNVSKASAMLKTRSAVLQKLHEQIQIQNDKLASSDAKWKPLVLDKQELITFALDEEEAANKLGDAIYKNAVTQTISRIKKMTTEEWVKKVSEWTGASSTVSAQPRPVDVLADLDSIGLSSLTQQISVLRHLKTPLEGLEKYGYITANPSAAEISSAKAGLMTAKGFETCDRCGTRFQVFPGRDDNGRLASGGSCRYHWARPNRGRQDAAYPCCNKPEGSEGCTEAETHVFVAKDPKRLANILQFEQTPNRSDLRVRQPVSFDCEMGYTTLGLEVIRITAVSWPDAKLLFDVFVRPYGEILDLNTRYSGVTKEAYASATQYSSIPPQTGYNTTGDEAEENTIQKVDSPAAARQLLFEFLAPDTPLIGHAIENDLNVVRVIHPFVVDTVLLYPHTRGLPLRYSLKLLSQKYLSRGIQSAGDAGHDSKEDAVATGDLVTKKVVDKWKLMKVEGWRFEEGIMMAPEETTI